MIGQGGLSLPSPRPYRWTGASILASAYHFRQTAIRTSHTGHFLIRSPSESMTFWTRSGRPLQRPSTSKCLLMWSQMSVLSRLAFLILTRRASMLTRRLFDSHATPVSFSRDRLWPPSSPPNQAKDPKGTPKEAKFAPSWLQLVSQGAPSAPRPTAQHQLS